MTATDALTTARYADVIRLRAVRMVAPHGFGYLGQALSSAELFATLYSGHYDPGRDSLGGHLPSAGIRSQLVLTWKIHCDVGPGPGSATELDRAAQSLDAVGEAGQARSARGISPADTVVADGQQQTAAARGE